MSPREIIDWTLEASGWGSLEALEARKWLDAQPMRNGEPAIERGPVSLPESRSSR